MKKLLACLLGLVLALAAMAPAFAEATYPDYLNLDSQDPIIKEGADAPTPRWTIVQDSTAGKWEDLWISRYFKDRYNIEFEVESILNTALSERKSLMFATGDLPDIMTGFGLSTSEILRYGQQEGLLLALDEYINEELTPNICRAFEDPAVSKIEIRARGADKPVIEIERKDAASFAMPAVQEVVLVDEIHRQALQLPNSTFRDDQIWTFFDGEQTIRARMEDADFLRVIDHGVFRLNAGDILVVNMHVCTKQTPSGLVSDYEVVRVLDVRKPGKHVLVPGV